MAEPDVVAQVAPATGRGQRLKRKLFTRKTLPLYLMILPALVLTFIFKYVTIPGHLIAFMDWRVTGFNGWAGLEHFKFIFALDYFWQAFINHWRFIIMGYLFVFPAPIILALLLNEVKGKALKRSVQTLTILPHFFNWVVIGAIFINILSPRFGFVNDIIRLLGGEPIYFLSKPNLFPWLMTFLRMWKGVGYSAIIYLAALSGVDPELYEAAVIDGAGRLRQTFAVTLPGLAPTIIVLFVLSFADVFGGLFEPVLVLKNSMVIEKAEILDTYIFEVGLKRNRFGMGAAAGLFKSTMGITLLLAVNWLSRRITPDGRGII